MSWDQRGSSGPPPQPSTPAQGYPQSSPSSQGPVPIQPYPTNGQPQAQQQQTMPNSSPYPQGGPPGQAPIQGQMNGAGQPQQGPQPHAIQPGPPHPAAQYYYHQPMPPQGYPYGYYTPGPPPGPHHTYPIPYDRGPSPHGAQPPYPPPTSYPSQPAPRQRTAIACRYCRRRKIRCSGFENSEGRCTNCQRFNQECVFTPVHSGQTQAFVPLQAANRGRGGYPPNQPVYGAFGQPLAYHYAVQAHPGFAPAPPGQPGAPPPDQVCAYPQGQGPYPYPYAVPPGASPATSQGTSTGSMVGSTGSMVGSTVPYYAQDGSSQQQYPQQGAPAAVPGEQQQYPSAPYTYPSQMAPGGAVPGAQQGASPTPTASTQRGSPMLTGPPEHNSNASSPSSAQPTGSDGRPGVSVSSLLDATGKPNKKGRSDADKDMVNRLGRS